MMPWIKQGALVDRTKNGGLQNQDSPRCCGESTIFELIDALALPILLRRGVREYIGSLLPIAPTGARGWKRVGLENSLLALALQFGISIPG